MSREDRLRELIAAYRAAADRGTPVSPDDLCRDDPELADRLRAAVADLTRSLHVADTVTRPPTDLAETPVADTRPVADGSRSAARPAGLPAVAGYAVERELGRGGMGVVYLARQVSLKRAVALKMIRGGADPSPEQLARFKAEAEAVAQLQHPNIVQIFEIGEHGGQPFFALEYVAGGSLAGRMTAGPVPPADAALLVETLARAVHHAHQKGIIHRDLKPGNVLLAEGGTPKVTDFGLAKRLADGDSARTRTGAVLGTPNYMAPEQAAGKVSRVGPATDVYALGVILYELLAGRVPFQGESVMDTLHLVLTADPVPPSKVRPGVGRDLETVCLKALAKDPAHRYPSALALAQDLERVRSGEPILARREGAVRKAWRKIRKRWATLALAAVAVAGVAVAAVVLSGSESERRAAGLAREFEDKLDAADWPEGHRDRLAQLVEDLRPVAPDRAAAAAKKLADRTAARFRDALDRPRLDPAEVPALEADLAWLAARDPAAARQLDSDLRRRLRAWQPVFDLAPPFAAAAEVFGPGVVKATPAGLAPVSTTAVTPTRVGSAGPVRVTAEFAPDWWEAHRAGVVVQLHRPTAGAGKPSGYAFQVAAVPPPTGPEEPAPKPAPGAKPAEPVPPTFAATGGHAVAAVLRNGAVLRQQPVTLPRGPLRLTAERDGDRLRLFVNDAEPLTFSDPVPLVGGDRVFAVAWPGAAPVSRLRAEAQAVPPAASPLERADDLYEQGNYAAALPLYEEQAAAARDPQVAAEARCKAGLCLVGLNRADEAAAAFEQVAASPGDRWPVIAACQLWVLRLRARQFDEADAVLSTLSVRYGKEQLAQYVPAHVRTEILLSYMIPATSYLFPDPTLTRRVEGLLKLAELLQETDREHSYRYALAVALTIAGEYVRAAEITRRLLPDVADRARLPGGSAGMLEWVARLHGWVSRFGGAIDKATGEVGAAMGKATADRPPEMLRRHAAACRFALVRLAAAAGNWQEAERVLAGFDGEYPKPYPMYHHYAQRWLLAGLIAEHKGDAAGAVAAWRQGSYRAYLEQAPPERRSAARTPTGRYELIDFWVMGSLADDLPDAEARDVVASLLASASGDPLVGQMASAVPVSPAVVRGAWRSPRGRELARRVALLDLPPVEFFRAGPLVLVYEKLRQELFAGSPTAAEEAELWRAVGHVSEAFFTGRVEKTAFLNLGLAWKGTTGLFGWGGVAGKLPADVRGPAAYLLGRRYAGMDPPRPKDAAAFFRTAVADAPADSALRRLAEAELAKLK